ncbi:hypothetical protein PENANT_c044G01967 [Penicillium antarcticum]|uniref:Uncharacterized protein n=1 Tax=Penicillium antarcticum TaxID=416450 RepID=A0A1V6PRW5_9EURO|nr:hypothetical protein PENANT_c044G01967 [Penicillium antarcticum]
MGVFRSSFVGSLLLRAVSSPLNVIVSLLVMALPDCLRLTAESRFVPDPFYLGVISKPTQAFALMTQVHMIIMEAFPTSSAWTAANFNYKWVVTLGTIMVDASPVIAFTFLRAIC